MLRELPRTVPVTRLARAGTVVEGRARLSGFRRLLAVSGTSARSAARDCEARLRFEYDEAGRLVVTGRASARVVALCQRCLNETEVALEAEIHTQVVLPGDRSGAAEGLEQAELDDERLDLLAFVEDELILAQSIHPAHPDGACTAPAVPDPALPDEPAPENPFAELKRLVLGG